MGYPAVSGKIDGPVLTNDAVKLRKWREANREHAREYDRARDRSGRYENCPEKRIARNRVATAIRDGKMQQQPCERCGAKAQAHHDDYSKPLEVRWLCRDHHEEHHSNVVPTGRASCERQPG